MIIGINVFKEHLNLILILYNININEVNYIMVKSEIKLLGELNNKDKDILKLLILNKTSEEEEEILKELNNNIKVCKPYKLFNNVLELKDNGFSSLVRFENYNKIVVITDNSLYEYSKEKNRYYCNNDLFLNGNDLDDFVNNQIQKENDLDDDDYIMDLKDEYRLEYLQEHNVLDKYMVLFNTDKPGLYYSEY